MKSFEELKELRKKLKDELINRDDEYAARIEVAMATCGITAGAREVLNTILEEIKLRGLKNIQVSQTGCPGLCYYEPLVTIIKPGNPHYFRRVEWSSKCAQYVINDQPIWLVNLGRRIGWSFIVAMCWYVQVQVVVLQKVKKSEEQI